MFYLDFHQLYRPTTLKERVDVRQSLNRDEVMERRLRLQRNLCFFCGEAVDMAGHLDHLIPVYYGGTNKPSNLVATCRDCNLTKHTDQIEITNPYTIRDYLKLQSAHRKWQKKIKLADAKGKYLLKKYTPKRVQLYRVYRADLFKRTNNSSI